MTLLRSGSCTSNRLFNLLLECEESILDGSYYIVVVLHIVLVNNESHVPFHQPIQLALCLRQSFVLSLCFSSCDGLSSVFSEKSVLGSLLNQLIALSFYRQLAVTTSLAANTTASIIAALTLRSRLTALPLPVCSLIVLHIY